MASPKPSDRAQQKDLRQRMRAAGSRDAAIAAEFGRRYRLRPRKAWRHAHGWTLREAAQRINDLAARDGIDPGSKAGMTAAHLCEYEEWPGGAVPGSGREPTGRKPTPYILSLLARAYSTTVPSLLDEADQTWLPPADRLVIGELGPAPAGAEPPRAGPAAADAAGPAAEVLTAAAEARRHAEQAAARRDVGDSTLAEARADVTRLSRAYMTGPPFLLFVRMRAVRARIHAALGLRLWPDDEADLYQLLSMLNSLMAVAAHDLGHQQAAGQLAAASSAYATIIGHAPLLAQVQSQLASIAYWSGRPARSGEYAARGLESLHAGPNAAQLHLHHGRAAARLGDARTARRAIGAAADAREHEHHDELLETGGEFGFSLATHHYLAGAALAELPGAEHDAAAELERATALYDRGPGPGEDHSFGCAALAHSALATTRLRAGQLDGAPAALAPVLALPQAKRISSLAPSLGRVRTELARYQRAPGAADLDERIAQFLGTAPPAGRAVQDGWPGAAGTTRTAIGRRQCGQACVAAGEPAGSRPAG